MEVVLALVWTQIILIPILGLLLVDLVRQNHKRKIILHNTWLIERSLRAKKRRK